MTSERTNPYTGLTVVETEAGKMAIRPQFWQESPTRPAKYTVEFLFGIQFRDMTVPGTEAITINRIPYSGSLVVEFSNNYRDALQPDESRNPWRISQLRTHIARTDGHAPTQAAGTVLYNAVADYVTSHDMTGTLRLTAEQTNAQYQADRLIEQARALLATAQQWSEHMAPADGRHYARGFSITLKQQ